MTAKEEQAADGLGSATQRSLRGGLTCALYILEEQTSYPSPSNFHRAYIPKLLSLEATCLIGVRSIYSFPSVFNSHSLLGKSYFLSLALGTLRKLAPNYLCRIFSQYSTSLLQQLKWSIYQIREVLCRILHYEQRQQCSCDISYM